MITNLTEYEFLKLSYGVKLMFVVNYVIVHVLL